VRRINRKISPDEYDAAIVVRPACCPLFAMGDRRGGRQLLADFAADDGWALEDLVASPAGRGLLAQIPGRVAGLAHLFAASAAATVTQAVQQVPLASPLWRAEDGTGVVSEGAGRVGQVERVAVDGVGQTSARATGPVGDTDCMPPDCGQRHGAPPAEHGPGGASGEDCGGGAVPNFLVEELCGGVAGGGGVGGVDVGGAGDGCGSPSRCGSSGGTGGDGGEAVGGGLPRGGDGGAGGVGGGCGGAEESGSAAAGAEGSAEEAWPWELDGGGSAAAPDGAWAGGWASDGDGEGGAALPCA
jgi:hypothetical protein